MIRIVIAEDQAMVLGALAALLDIEPDLEVVARASNGRKAFVDGGVVLGLMWGLAVIWWLFVRYLIGAKIPLPGDLPPEKAASEQAAVI